MIKFFRKIRYNLMSENKTGKYFKYAIGEIILVVIGILIALQINNWNEARKTRDKEIVYLNNIKSDLENSVQQIETFILKRNTQIKTSNEIIEYFEGKPIQNWNDFNKKLVDIYSWDRFYLIKNTYEELKNSGNLSLISNNDIKKGLQDLELLYAKLKIKESHYRHDAETTLHEGSYEMQNIHEMSNNYAYQMSNGKMGELGELNENSFGDMLKDRKQMNGFALTAYIFTIMNGIFHEMNQKCADLISQIDKELDNTD